VILMHLREVDANLLVTLDALLVDASVTRAAERLGRSASAISHALAKLREIFADELFVRAGQRLVPTAKALELAPTVHVILAGMESLLRPSKPFDPCVPASQIAEHGAVSESVAQAMAVGMARVSGADFALGITGIAGPSGGTPEKPVGMVVISAVRARGGAVETRVRTFNFVGGRDMVRFQASQAALDMVRRWIAEEAPAAL
jgi:hypothetical protein